MVMQVVGHSLTHFWQAMHLSSTMPGRPRKHSGRMFFSHGYMTVFGRRPGREVLTITLNVSHSGLIMYPVALSFFRSGLLLASILEPPHCLERDGHH